MNIMNIRIELKNPFDRWDYFRNLGCISGGMTMNKAWELEHSYYSPMLFDADVRWTRKTDHAGLDITIGILGYGISFRIYDTRHYNSYYKAWEKEHYGKPD
jgi:hypothetical protein